MSLPEGLKQAAEIAANEVLVEWIDDVIADPAAAAEQLGTTFQEYLAPESLDEAEARRLLDDVKAWDRGGDDGPVARFARARFAAAMDIARALIAWTTEVGEVPEAVAPLEAELAALVDVVGGAIDEGGFDEETFDIEGLLSGKV